MSDASSAGAARPTGGEWPRVLPAQLYGFCLMAAYGLLKPLREEMGVQCGARNLEWLWLGTLVVSIAVLPPYWRLVATLPRRRVIAWVNRAVALTLLCFFALFHTELHHFKPNDVAWIAAASRDAAWLHDGLLALPLLPLALYVWISVFNLLVLSLFWSVMADRHDAAQGKRLFGPIAIGITVGAITGSAIVIQFADELKTYGLLVVSALLLEVATQLGCRLAGDEPAPPARSPQAGAGDVARRWLAGFTAMVRSPYLAGLIGYQFLSIAASTALYAARTELMGASGLAKEARTALFGWNDFATQTVALLLQAFVATRLLRRFGLGVSLALQMVVAIAGFVALGLSVDAAGTLAADASWRHLLFLPAGPLPLGLAAVLFFFVLQKGVEYGLSKPSRETLFTVVSRDEKYQAKSLIDTGLYRAFDQLTIFGNTRLRSADTGLGLALSSCAFVMAPVMALGVVLAFWLGREHRRRAERTGGAATPS